MAEVAVTVNGEHKEFPTPLTVGALLHSMGIGGAGRIAVERNGEILPKSQFDDTQVEQGDRFEIVHAIGGG